MKFISACKQEVFEMSFGKIIQCVPNYSEGKDLEKVEMILDCFRGKEGVKLLDYSSNKDHNRTVVTLIGEPEPLMQAVIKSVGVAAELIDLSKHKGEHPRMGATDVIPFIPIRNTDMKECVDLSVKVACAISEKYGIPTFLYEKSATSPQRANLADIRKGEYEGMFEKIKRPEWKPDFGPAVNHPKAGATVVGARMPLVAFNINLNTNNLDIATKIAKNIRYINGGLRYVKALGIDLKERNIVQISINMTDYTKTSLYRAYELVKIEAQRFGVVPVGSEIVGLVPMQALIDTAEYYLGLEDFSNNQILETRIWE